MCIYKIAIDDALMEKVRPAIGEGVEESKWMQQQVEMLLVQVAASQKKPAFDENYMANLIDLSASAWKGIKDADSWVHEIRG